MASIEEEEEHDAFNRRMEEKHHSTTQASAKNSPNSQKQQFQHAKAARSSKQGQRQGTSHKNLQPGLQKDKDSEGCHGKYISDGQNNDGITEKGGSQIKISEMISKIFDSIPELEAFASDKEPLGAIIGHEADLILNIERPYPPLLRRPAYPASPKSREDLEAHIKELLDLSVIRKVGHNEDVEITTPVIVAWHNGKFRMVGDFRPLNTYTIPDRYPIPKIQIVLTQISQEVYITIMDSLQGFHQNVVTPRARK
ncbi:hypothetical protein O181_076852 [Austropuccinia psidii MF-1]|uniref:Reverse transcriptase domain-containing protein n=1 Tax=Austropuccinia psidii MF-1 TaxID=1389203 RepID=A0A9Q3FHN9_9BASI|nr:hypothetical protein [Austropuccinia psidii MF-1]